VPEAVLGGIGAARSAANKLHALLPAATAAGVEHLRHRLRVQPAPPTVAPRVLAVLEQAVTDSTAVRLRHTDRPNASTQRTVKAAGFYGTPDGWALAASCQLRDDARLFRLDRIQTATGTKQICPARDLDTVLGWLPAPPSPPPDPTTQVGPDQAATRPPVGRSAGGLGPDQAVTPGPLRVDTATRLPKYAFGMRDQLTA